MAKTDAEVIKLADEWISLSETGDDSTVQDERREAYRYYYGEPFGNEREGRSDYVSRDVFDAVEDTKEILLEVFTSNRETIKFTPKQEDDVLQSKLRTSYCNRVFHQNNSGYTILHDSIQDALLAKNCTAKVYRDEGTDLKSETVSGITPEQYQALEAAEEAGELEIVESKQDEETLLIDAELQREVDASKTVVEIVRPENVVRDPNATGPGDARFWGEFSDVTRSDLVEMGFDQETVDGLVSTDEDSTGEIEEQAREGDGYLDQDEIGEKSQEILQLYELWMWFDDDDDGRAELYQVFKVGKTLLEKNPMQRMPYFNWAAMRVAHRYEGISTYDVVGDIQKLKSTIKRQVSDHLMMSNNQSRIARAGVFKNPAALIENDFGAVHWVDKQFQGTMADAIWDNPPPQLSPMTMTMLEMLDQDKEHRAGVSRLTSGLNQDVISNQNADDLINRMTSSAMRRVMGMARRYAELFLIPIFQEIYTLGLEHDKEGLMAEVDGQWQQLVPQEMGDGVDMRVSTALTPDDAESRARTLMVLHNSLIQSLQFDSSMSALYAPQNKYALLREVFNLSGQPQPEFLTNPNSGPGQMQQQLMQMQQQMQQLTAQNQQLQGIVQQFNQQELAVKQQDAATRQYKAQTDAELGHRKQALDEDAEAHDQMMDETGLVTERAKISLNI